MGLDPDFESGTASGLAESYHAGAVLGCPRLVTSERISGVRAVHISQSGHLRIAMASVSGRMPAIGVVFSQVESGRRAMPISFGAVQFFSDCVDFSGFVGRVLYAGRSGHVAPLSGSWNSGGFLSGDAYQSLGIATNSGGAHLNVHAFSSSGGACYHA